MGKGRAHFSSEVARPLVSQTPGLRPLLCQHPQFVDENRGSHIDRGSRTKPWKPSYIRISALSGSVQNLFELRDLLRLELDYLELRL